MDASRLPQGQLIAAGAGALLLLSLFLPWIGAEGGGPSLTGWESQNTLDLYLFVVALFAIVPALMAMSGNDNDVAFAGPATAFVLSAIGTLLTLYVFLDPAPEAVEVSRKFGLILALLAVAAVTYGQYQATNEDLATRR